ncbi:hypothetical protein LBMAG42_27720 [Deltaproteobacteria bacterium]|nr:hypothetical protein LBMAG42_27720 [Deltaproteobacteria bacterium]
MEAPATVNATVLAAFEAALPADPRVATKKMFGMPCAFVHRQMFFGTFGGCLVARVGPARAGQLVEQGGLAVFTPTPDQPWHDYVEIDPSQDAATIKALAAEALNWASKLPLKGKKPRARSRRASPG